MTRGRVSSRLWFLSYRDIFSTGSQPADRSPGRLARHSANQPTNQPSHEPTKPRTNKATNQPVSRFVSQTMQLKTIMKSTTLYEPGFRLRIQTRRRNSFIENMHRKLSLKIYLAKKTLTTEIVGPPPFFKFNLKYNKFQIVNIKYLDVNHCTTKSKSNSRKRSSDFST